MIWNTAHTSVNPSVVQSWTLLEVEVLEKVIQVVPEHFTWYWMLVIFEETTGILYLFITSKLI